MRSTKPCPSSHARSSESRFPGFRWVLPHGAAATAPPGPSDLEGWLATLRQQRITVLVSLDGRFPVSSLTLARQGVHLISCPLKPDRAPSLDRALALCGGLVRLLRQGERIAVCCDDDGTRTAQVLGALLLWMGRSLGEAHGLAQHLGAPEDPAWDRFLTDFQRAVAETELTGQSSSRIRCT